MTSLSFPTVTTLHSISPRGTIRLWYGRCVEQVEGIEIHVELKAAQCRYLADPCDDRGMEAPVTHCRHCCPL